MRIQEFVLPPGTVQARPGDVVVADPDGAGWRVLIVEDRVTLGRLVPFGDGGRLVAEADLVDSNPPRWSGEIHLLVSLFAERFATADDAAVAFDDGRLGAPVHSVCLPAAGLTTDRATVHRAAG